MSPTDQNRYAPERRVTVDVPLVVVEDWFGSADWPWRDGRSYLLPVHPWQLERAWSAPRVFDTVPAAPLMSLRTLAPLDGGPHLKTAIDAQLTSAPRLVSPASIHNGPRLAPVIAALEPDLELLADVFGGGAVVAGAASGRHAAILRRPPTVRPGDVLAPVAALCATRPDGPPALIRYAGADLAGWVGRLAAVLLAPALRLLAAGIALEAHGQNTLVVLRDGLPERVVYRDLGGVRVHAGRLARRGIAAPALVGALPTGSVAELRTKLAASALSTLLGEVVAVSVRAGPPDTDAERLWAAVDRALDAADPDDARALRRDPWPVKAMTAMRLAADGLGGSDPLADQFTAVPNPLARLR